MEEKNYRYVGVTVGQALELMREALGGGEKPSWEMEELPLEEALGRIAGSDYCSPMNQPPFDRSPLDGYAVRAADTTGAGREHPAYLAVTQEILAGGYPREALGAGQAARIMTGAPIPAGADCIIRQEDTDYGEERVAIYKEMAPWDNYCYAGEDFRKGDCLLEAGTRLGAVELGILAGMGYGAVKVRRKLQAALFSTGDELQEPGGPLAPGKIYNSNLFVLRGRLEEMGIEVAASQRLPDSEQEVAQAMERVLPRADIILSTGGVSVGKRDILHGALELLGAEKVFWRVKVKPGTPTIFALAQGTPILALSGNPFGALAHLELLARPLLALLSGDSALLAPRKEAVLQDPFPKGSAMERIVRGYYREGKVYLPKGLHSSGCLSSMQGCNCLIDIPAGSAGLAAGDEVSVILLEKGEKMPCWMKQSV